MQASFSVTKEQLLPAEVRQFTDGAVLRETSGCSGAATYFIDRDNGYYLKIAAHGMLARQQKLTAYFHKKGYTPAVCLYLCTAERDYFITEACPGESGISERCLSDPKQLCALLAQSFSMLHETPCADCIAANPYPTCMDTPYHPNMEYLSVVWENPTQEAIDALYQARNTLLKPHTLIHGDACLPNILFHNNRFSGFIDVGDGGQGDYHFDIFWTLWSLSYNLKTRQWNDYFLDCYGRTRIDKTRLLLCGLLSSC